MKRTLSKLTVALALALPAAAALSNGASAEKYYVDGRIWGGYQEYLRNIGNGNKPGAFAITTDGHNAYYTWCQEIRCVAGPTYSHDAKTSCEHEYGQDCVVFAVRDDIKVEYEVVASASDPSPPAGTPQVETEPASKIAVSSVVQADIDVYLHNAHSAGRAWALAIAKDGSGVGSAACSISNSYTGGPCEPGKGGTPQDLASKEAIKRCGGPTDCVLLYVGEKKAADIEIVTQ